LPHTLTTGTFVDLQDRFIAQAKSNRALDPLAPLTVLVPGQLVRSGCSHANIRFLTVNEIARRIAGPRMRSEGLQIIADVTRDLLLKNVVDSVKDKLVYFARIADFRGFRTKLHSTISDLRNACATVPMLREAADDDMSEFKKATTQKIREIALLWEAYDTLLTEHYLTDRSGVLELAIDVLEDNGCDSHSLIAYGLDELSELERRFLFQLWQHRDVTVHLPWCDTPAYEFTRGLREWLLDNSFDDQTPLHEQAESGTMLSVAQRGLFQEVTAEQRSFDSDDASISILSTSDAFRESDEIIREVLFPPSRVADPAETFPPNRVADPAETSAILMRGAKPYTNLLRNAIRRSQFEAYFHECRTLGDSHTGKALRKFVRLLNADYARLDVADFLLCGSLKVPDELSEQYTELPVAEWNQFSLLAGATAGEENWRVSLARLKDQIRWESKQTDAEDEDRVTDYTSRLQSLDAFIGWLNSFFGAISRIRDSKTFSDAVSLMHAAICERITSDSVIEEVFQQLEQAAQLDTAMFETDIAGLASCFESALSTPAGREGRYQETEPTVATIEQARGVVFDHVYLAGLNESEFPRFTPQDPLLLDYERELLSTALSLGTYSITIPHLSNRVEYERYLFATALHSARRRVLLSFSRTGSQGRETLPSRFLLNTVSPLIAASADVGLMNEFIEAHSFSRCVTLRDLPLAQDTMHRREYDAATIQYALQSGNAALFAHLKQSRIFMRGLDAERHRYHERAFTKYDGALPEEDARVLSEKAFSVLSASQLETYWTCPFRWFAGRVLNLDRIEDADRLAELDAMIRGRLIHEILEQFYREAKLSGKSDKLNLDNWKDLESFAQLLLSQFEHKQPTGVMMIWSREKRRIMESLERFFRFDIESRAGFVPTRFEWKFGDSDHSIALEIDANLSIRLRGAIDRIDQHANGSLRILDYKSGKNYAGLRSDNLLSQRALQLHLYSDVAEQVLKQPVETAEYYFMRASDNESVTLARETAQNDDAKLRGILKVIISGMRSGNCYPYPDEDVCKHCRVRAACGSGRQTWKWRQPTESARDFQAIREGEE
jgi:RecB family exonuclease